MTLSELLEALAENSINIQLIEVDGTTKTPIITFNAGGYEGVESDLLSKTVNKITVDGSKLIKVEYAKGV